MEQFKDKSEFLEARVKQLEEQNSALKDQIHSVEGYSEKQQELEEEL